jgi:hypothetical protein
MRSVTNYDSKFDPPVAGPSEPANLTGHLALAVAIDEIVSIGNREYR